MRSRGSTQISILVSANSILKSIWKDTICSKIWVSMNNSKTHSMEKWFWAAIQIIKQYPKLKQLLRKDENKLNNSRLLVWANQSEVNMLRGWIWIRVIRVSISKKSWRSWDHQEKFCSLMKKRRMKVCFRL